MRDPHDAVTAEIPGVDPLPPKPVRTTIGERMAAVVYMSPKQVQSCRNCRHRAGNVHNPDSFAESVSHRCGLHDFPVQLGGVCADHEE